MLLLVLMMQVIENELRSSYNSETIYNQVISNELFPSDVKCYELLQSLRI